MTPQVLHKLQAAAGLRSTPAAPAVVKRQAQPPAHTSLPKTAYA